MATLTKKYNLLKTNSTLAKEWHPAKNGDLRPEEVTPGSERKVWWRCQNGHEWQDKVVNRNRAKGCPYCSNKKLSPDNSLEATNPALAKEWHPSKNGDLGPLDILPGTLRKVWWKCEKGHEWQAVVASRNRGNGCPYCSNRKISQDKSLAATNPALAKEWHPIKNGDLRPDNIFSGTGRKVWWRCEKGHEWQAMVVSRNRGSGCPYCLKNKKPSGNFFLIENPTLSKEWHPQKNGNLTPANVSSGSGKKVWWRCKNGHEWQATVVSRNSRGTGCPYCANRKISPDNSLAAINPTLAKEWHPIKNVKLTSKDVVPGSEKKVWWRCKKGHEWQATIVSRNRGCGCPYCSSKKTCRENSLAVKNPSLAKEWHPTKNGDLTPKDVSLGSNKKVWWRCKKDHEWEAIIYDRNRGDGCPYCSNRKISKDNSLAVINPLLAKEWHPIKNGDLSPTDVAPVSGMKVWWRCKKGHEWQSVIANRKNGTSCPYCANKKISPDNSLAAMNPTLAKEWHPTKNGTLSPTDVFPVSGKRVWWICKKGHEWQSEIYNRSRGGHGCPYCSNHRVCDDNCLATVNRKLAMEWHPTKNGRLTPRGVVPNSNKKVWWRCKKGHDWLASICNRNGGTGCPYCANQKVCDDNCLATINRNLAMEWHPTKNRKLTPRDVVANSDRKVWWMCFKGHEWQTTIYLRNSAYIKNRKGTSCPYCMGKRKVPKEIKD